MKEYEEAKHTKLMDPDRYKIASVMLMSLPDLSRVAYQTGCIECDCCKCVLSRQPDFMQQRSGIEEAYDKYNAEHGTNHRCLFLPKFHPELNYIERIWGRMKYYIRLHCDTKFDTMAQNIASAIEPHNLPIAMVRRFARNSFAYLFAYRHGKDIITAHEWVKKHRVHRQHSKQMDLALDRSVDLIFDEDLERLYFPFGRPAAPQNAAGMVLEAVDLNSDEEIGEVPTVVLVGSDFVDDDDSSLNELYESDAECILINESDVE